MLEEWRRSKNVTTHRAKGREICDSIGQETTYIDLAISSVVHELSDMIQLNTNMYAKLKSCSHVVLVHSVDMRTANLSNSHLHSKY